MLSLSQMTIQIEISCTARRDFLKMCLIPDLCPTNQKKMTLSEPRVINIPQRNI